MKVVSNNKTELCVKSLKLMGDFWTLRIIDALKVGDTRFCELQRAVGNVNPVTLTNRLQKLENSKLIKRKALLDNISVIYSLTQLGKESLPILQALNSFAKKLNK
ncbi:helix-turn-helix transcriptional regulator [Patescibacteria group bacterium]|nr:helix-turn-helix transcriptional regulator [Patescibacteria group bacterium]